MHGKMNVHLALRLHELCGKMCSASITRTALDAPRGCHELDPAAHPLAHTRCRKRATTGCITTRTGRQKAADDADASGLVGLADRGPLPAIAPTAVRPRGPSPDQIDLARLGAGLPG